MDIDPATSLRRGNSPDICVAVCAPSTANVLKDVAFPYVRIGGRVPGYLRADVEAFVAAHVRGRGGDGETAGRRRRLDNHAPLAERRHER